MTKSKQNKLIENLDCRSELGRSNLVEAMCNWFIKGPRKIVYIGQQGTGMTTILTSICLSKREMEEYLRARTDLITR